MEEEFNTNELENDLSDAGIDLLSDDDDTDSDSDDSTDDEYDDEHLDEDEEDDDEIIMDSYDDEEYF